MGRFPVEVTFQPATADGPPSALLFAMTKLRMLVIEADSPDEAITYATVIAGAMKRMAD